jgi:hypothetical protein
MKCLNKILDVNLTRNLTNNLVRQVWWKFDSRMISEIRNRFEYCLFYLERKVHEMFK